MSLFGLFDSKKTETTNTTQTNQTDNSKNVGEGATLLEAGSSFSVQDLSGDVAIRALDATADVAKTAVGASTQNVASVVGLGNNAISSSYALGAKALDSLERQTENATLAAQNAVSYGRQLAELGFNSQVNARASDTERILDTGGKYLLGIGAAAVVLLAIFLNRKRSA